MLIVDQGRLSTPSCRSRSPKADAAIYETRGRGRCQWALPTVSLRLLVAVTFDGSLQSAAHQILHASDCVPRDASSTVLRCIKALISAIIDDGQDNADGTIVIAAARLRSGARPIKIRFAVNPKLKDGRFGA